MADAHGDVIVISQLPPPVHGSTVMTRTFMDVLVGSGRRPVLVDRRFSRSVDEIGSKSIKKVFSGISLLFRLGTTLRHHRDAAVVFFTTNRPPSFWVDVVMSVELRMLRRPYIAYVHTSGYRALAERGALHRGGVALLLGGATSLVVLGKSMLRDVQQFNEAPSVIPNAVGGPERRATAVGGSSTIAFLSNLIPGKGAEDFMRIANRCLTNAPDARAIVIGRASSDGYAEGLRAILDPEVRDRVDFIGAIFDEARDGLLATASVLVFPSTYRYEAQPLTVLEAMRVGVPVVAYDVGGLRDVIDDDVNGFLVRSGDWEAASERCRIILSSRDDRDRLAAGALRTFRERFGLARYSAAWTELLERGA
ncbi:glycosyltransferase family 4 protein [Curtobacterium sp. ME26]|uniref:glycosyltransferase family 4 protein n=1 Tax=Curtobacterium sp. ME26 TaxID=2744254 RepID=UPI0015F39767|nr:glycosyltransferase family 4 protein [Curtobacterium sp. ME26]